MMRPALPRQVALLLPLVLLPLAVEAKRVDVHESDTEAGQAPPCCRNPGCCTAKGRGAKFNKCLQHPRRYPHCQALRPVDCATGWSAWGACSATCGVGTEARALVVVQEARNGGQPCADIGRSEQRACQAAAGPCVPRCCDNSRCCTAKGRGAKFATCLQHPGRFPHCQALNQVCYAHEGTVAPPSGSWDLGLAGETVKMPCMRMSDLAQSFIGWDRYLASDPCGANAWVYFDKNKKDDSYHPYVWAPKREFRIDSQTGQTRPYDAYTKYFIGEPQGKITITDGVRVVGCCSQGAGGLHTGDFHPILPAGASHPWHARGAEVPLRVELCQPGE